MQVGVETLPEDGTDEYLGALRDILADRFREVEPFVPIVIVREVDETGEEAFVSRPILPVAHVITHQREPIEKEPVAASIDRVIQAVAEASAQPRRILTGSNRSADVLMARYAAIYIARNWLVPQPTLTKIGATFYKDHSTIMNAIDRVEGWLSDKEPAGSEKKQKISALIEKTRRTLEDEGHPAEQNFKDVRIENLVCMCLDGLVVSPLVDVKGKQLARIKRRPSDTSIGVDWERSSQTAEVYHRYGGAALSLAKNILANAKR